MNPIVIPNRFESLVGNESIKAQPTLIQVDKDLKPFDYLGEKVRSQGGGILAFVLGPTGLGKSTAVFSASVFLKERLGTLVRVPVTIPLREAAEWLTTNIQTQAGKVVPVLFDGREVTDDEVGLKQFLTALNQFLRSRNDVLFLWPTTDAAWHQEIRETAEKIGGANFAPADADITLIGPPKDSWSTILDRILLQFDTKVSEVGLDPGFIDKKTAEAATIGDFLGEISTVIAQRTSEVRKIKSLPHVIFVVSSGPEVTGEANRIRRAGSHILKAEELLAYSPRSEAGKWWIERQKNPEHNLGYIISLLRAKLSTLSASAVAYACLHEGKDDLGKLAEGAGMIRHTTNLSTTVSATDLYRLLTGTTVGELTSTKKGKLKDTTAAAYAAIQARSAKEHRAINESILKSLSKEIKEIDPTNVRYEVDAGDQNLYTDAIIGMKNEDYFLEFHHLSSASCTAAAMSAYIMDKLRAYAIHYQLIPR
jgi:hypothetical protein